MLALAALLLAAAVAFAQDPRRTARPRARARADGRRRRPGPSWTPSPPSPPISPPSSGTRSRAVGHPAARGRLVRGVQLPELGEDFFTWDPIDDEIPNREWRRWGTDRLVRTVLGGHPRLPDAVLRRPARRDHGLSRPRGGPSARNFGGLGHASHQNGLDADILYPRTDDSERRPVKPVKVDRGLAQDLVDRFVAAGAGRCSSARAWASRARGKVVVPLIHHDDHLHVRIR